MTVPELLSLAVIVGAGTGGELAVTRAMKNIGEVHDFSPSNIIQVLKNAFTEGWMWFGISLMALAFFALLACFPGRTSVSLCLSLRLVTWLARWVASISWVSKFRPSDG